MWIILYGFMHLVFNYLQTTDSVHFFCFKIIHCGTWLLEFPLKYCDFPFKIKGFSQVTRGWCQKGKRPCGTQIMKLSNRKHHFSNCCFIHSYLGGNFNTHSEMLKQAGGEYKRRAKGMQLGWHPACTKWFQVKEKQTCSSVIAGDCFAT